MQPKECAGLRNTLNQLRQIFLYFFGRKCYWQVWQTLHFHNTALLQHSAITCTMRRIRKPVTVTATGKRSGKVADSASGCPVSYKIPNLPFHLHGKTTLQVRNSHSAYWSSTFSSTTRCIVRRGRGLPGSQNSASRSSRFSCWRRRAASSSSSGIDV